MDWQEYQEAVARLHEQAEGIGQVRRNVYLPDRVTRQRRQIDVLLEVDVRGHDIRVVIDAKYRKEKLDVKDIEEIIELAKAVGANKCVIVAANGWSKPAEKKADFVGMDLMLLDVEQALDLVVPDKWQLCPGCEEDCIVLDHDGTLVEIVDGMERSYSVFIAGQCRACRLAFVWCWACGGEGHLKPDTSQVCGCGHEWFSEPRTMSVRPHGRADVIAI